MSTYCIDPNAVRREVEKGAQGILPVHIFGHPAAMGELSEIAQKANIPLIEDACQAHGAMYKGKMAGNLALAAAFSFYPSKNMSVLGDGGMVTTNDDKIADAVRKLRDAGRTSHYEHDMLGYTARMNTINAAIGRVQLKNLTAWNEKRRTVAEAYHKRLGSLKGIKLPSLGDNDVRPVFHQFVVVTEQRDKLKEFLESSGIQCGIHYPIPIHLQPIYKKLFGYKQGDYPSSERFARECLSLPMHPNLTTEDVTFICEKIEEFCR